MLCRVVAGGTLRRGDMIELEEETLTAEMADSAGQKQNYENQPEKLS